MGKVLQGRVVSAGNDKTISVLVSNRKVHPVYKKSYSISKKYAVHDEANKAKMDDLVTIEETKPISKTKRWALKEITGSAAIAHKEPEPVAEKTEEEA